MDKVTPKNEAVINELVDKLLDAMYGNPKLTFAANDAVCNILGLEQDENEHFIYEDEYYSFDQLVEYVLPQVLPHQLLEERLQYECELHHEKVDIMLSRAEEDLPVLGEQPWIFPEFNFRCVNGAGDAFYSNKEPICIAGKNWVIEGYTLNYRGHKMRSEYSAKGCAVSLQELESASPLKIRNLADGSLATKAMGA